MNVKGMLKRLRLAMKFGLIELEEYKLHAWELLRMERKNRRMNRRNAEIVTRAKRGELGLN